jgi:preprotein translocase subunit SecD
VLIVAGIVAIGSKIWSGGGATLQAAVRFEVRLAEAQPTLGLRPARIAGSDRVVYLHPEIVVTNDDISESRVIQGNAPSRFGVAVELNAAGAEKMRKATAGHIGGPVAILIDGDVVAATIVKSAIGNSAVISGDFTKAEAERIANGMSIR